MSITFDHAILFLKIYPEANLSHVQNDVFIVTLIAKHRKPKCPPTEDWENKLCS